MGWSMSPMDPAGMFLTTSSKITSGAMPRFWASRASRCPNSCLNQVTIQKPRNMNISMSQVLGMAAGQVKNFMSFSLMYFRVMTCIAVAVPKLISAICGSSAPAPRSSLCLSPAPTTTGSPSGRPVSCAACLVTCPRTSSGENSLTHWSWVIPSGL